MHSMQDETPEELARRLDPLHDLNKAIVKVKSEHREAMLSAIAAGCFGLSLAVVDGVMTSRAAADYERQLRAIADKTDTTSAHTLDSLRDEIMQEIAKGANTKRLAAGGSLNMPNPASYVN